MGYFIYIAGPMRGIPDLNFPLFEQATDRFRVAGWKVWSPVEIGRRLEEMTIEEPTPAQYLAADLASLVRCSDIALLPGWEQSIGAKCEVAVAITLGMQFWDAITMNLINTPESVTISCGYPD